MSILENSGHTQQWSSENPEFVRDGIDHRTSLCPCLGGLFFGTQYNMCPKVFYSTFFPYENGSLFSLVHFFKKGTPKCGQLKEFVWLWLTQSTLYKERLRELACNNNHLAQFLHEKKICLFFYVECDFSEMKNINFDFHSNYRFCLLFCCESVRCCSSTS